MSLGSSAWVRAAWANVGLTRRTPTGSGDTCPGREGVQPSEQVHVNSAVGLNAKGAALASGTAARHLSGRQAPGHLPASRTFVRGVVAAGHLSAASCLGTFVRAVSRADICPVWRRHRTFCPSRNADGHLSGAVWRPDICPRRFAPRHLSGAVSRADICPRPGRLVVSSRYCTR
jgi:hypothetical protein